MSNSELEGNERRRRFVTAGAVAAFAAIIIGAGAAAAAVNCESLAGKSFGDATIAAAFERRAAPSAF